MRSDIVLARRRSRLLGGACVLALACAMACGPLVHAAISPLKPPAQLVQEVVDFLMSDVGNGGIRTMDGDPEGAAVPPYFYHYAIQHDDDLTSSVTGYPGYASISYPGYTASVAIDAFLAWWTYSGDPRGLQRALALADWLVPRRTPVTDLYANWPYSTQTDGVMGGGFDGDAIMSDKPGMFALRLLRLADITQDPSYEDAAAEIADTYVATQMTTGDADDGRWPFRVRPSDGLVRQDYTSDLMPAIRLLEAMEPRRPGHGYGQAAARAWAWLWANPLDSLSSNFQHWEGFYEDISPQEAVGLEDHYSAEETVLGLIDRALPGDLQKAVEVLDWSTTNYLAPTGLQDGYGAYAPCMLEWSAWLNSTYAATGQWAYVSLRLEEATRGTALHDASWRTRAIAALNTLTYGQGTESWRHDGRMLTTVRELTQPQFGIETWYEQNFNTVKYLLLAFGVAPELAPDDELHLLRYAQAEPTAVERTTNSITTQWGAAGLAQFKAPQQPAGVRLQGVWQWSPGTEPTPVAPAWTWDSVSRVCTVVHEGGEVVVALAGATPVDGSSTASQVRAARLLPPYPVPANPKVSLPYELAAAGPMRLAIFDLRGRRIAVVAERSAPAGAGQAVWDGRDSGGQCVASGVYMAELRSGGVTARCRFSLVR